MQPSLSIIDRILWYCDCHITLAVCCFGICGNTLSIFVWQKLKQTISPTNFSIVKLFTLLATIDICVLVSTLFVDFLPAAYPEIKSYSQYIITFIYVGHPLHFYFLFVSILLTTAISLDRLKLVLFPLFGLRHGAKITKYIIASVFALSVVFDIPSFFEYQMVETFNSTTLIKVDYESHERFRNIVFISHCTGGVIIPWVTICIANSLILLKINKRKGKETANKKTSIIRERDEHLRMTFVLVFVTGSCLVLLGFQCVSRCVLMFVHETSLKRKIVKTIARFGNLAIPLNSSLNIVLFCLPGKFFRSQLIKMIKKKFVNKEKSKMESSTQLQALSCNTHDIGPKKYQSSIS